MSKIAFKIKLKAGAGPEYRKRHDKIWPELAALLKDNGISDYSIFVDEETHILFAVQQQEGASSQTLGRTLIMQKWWAYMADIMETNPDNSPVSVKLEQVFHLD